MVLVSHFAVFCRKYKIQFIIDVIWAKEKGKGGYKKFGHTKFRDLTLAPNFLHKFIICLQNLLQGCNILHKDKPVFYFAKQKMYNHLY